ncbi:ankyrin repeat domain-containing protein 34B-like [Acipenser oxyrinchus oxyrinchus]|uniref:Ankyrin repeat domain-containing protein 34B-like n=1 Tax=Acipenser oxyrinchus oxyrinchus TaxID=40147 RepID=A0AAD8LVG2_ACIOX|nr:ankyrin repeat domain-containing protein 34B-like [Acipenser oxyrinchus oxyrinchus]
MDDAMEVRTDGNSLLKAVYLCRLRLTRLLLEGGAYINESNERGETPLMIACKTKHVDQQSVTKAKMVKYLLENNADPNIQDKTGKTALMHACLERAGVEVVSLLLKSGADPSLDDHSSSSALVYAVNSEDKDTLKVLLDACKARGKEVIIITTDKSLSGRQMTKQYLNVPPPPDLDDRHSPIPCMSPSEIELKTTSPLSTCTDQEPHLFNFKDQGPHSNGKGLSQPGSPTRKPSPARGVAKLLHLQRLHSEPWLKIPQSLLHQNKATSLNEDLQDITPEEEVNRLPFLKQHITRHQSIDVKDTSGLLKTLEQAPGGAAPRKMSYDEIYSRSSHVDACRNSSAVPVDQDPDSIQILAVSSLRNIVQRRNIGADHYSSDSQLPVYTTPVASEDSKGLLEKKLMSMRSSTMSSSRESLENVCAASVSRRHPGVLERRGSGALLLDHISHTRPGYLPPLNPHPPIPDIGANNNKPAGVISGGPKPLIPTAPAFPKDLKAKKMLLRRHSMQTEQIKQLVNFEEIFGH